MTFDLLRHFAVYHRNQIRHLWKEAGYYRSVEGSVVTVLGLGFPAVALGYPMGWVMCALLLTIRYRRSVLFRAEKTDAKS